MHKSEDLPEEMRAMIERERIRPEFDQFGPRLAMKMSGELYMAVANYRRERFLESRPQAERERLTVELFD